jgi:hypothetical protein
VSPLPTYTFLPWLRRGIANEINRADGDASVKVRATLPIDLTLTGYEADGGTLTENVHREVDLVGPGDVLGIEPRAIFKVEPRNWITNFEPNYLPFIEFYDEDFPWRYVPAAPDVPRHRLRPWICLAVLTEEEFVEGVNVLGRPLPYVELAAGLDPLDVLPPPAELWAWAHVHVNDDLSSGGDTSIGGVLQRFDAAIAANPDHAYSRIVCPRRLAPNVTYHAFLIPTFETGRLAGLGLDVPATTVATSSSYGNGQTQFPYYYRWQFKTGAFGDFEYLVKLLQPRAADKRVGVRDMDVMHPGPMLPRIDVPAELGGVLKLGGALQVPFATLEPDDQAEVTKYDRWDAPYPHPFQEALARHLNLADDYTRAVPEVANPDGDPDPVVTLPIYGRRHALVDRVLETAEGAPAPNRENWVHRLNLDPRYRVAAGFGTRVVRENDERYMNAAWQQIGAVLEANRRIRLAQLAQAASTSIYTRHVASLPAARALMVTAPIHPRVAMRTSTVAAHVASSIVPAAVTSAPFRKLTRPGAPLVRRLELAPSLAEEVLVGINEGEIVASPPKVAPPNATSVADAATEVESRGAPRPWGDLLERFPWIRFVPFLVAALLVLLALLAGWAAAVGVAAVAGPAAVWAFRSMTSWMTARRLGRWLREEAQTPRSVDDLPDLPDFVVSRPGDAFTARPGASDGPEARRFKAALRDAHTFTSVDFPVPERKPLDLRALAEATVAALDPAVTIPRRVGTTLNLPAWVRDNMVEAFTPVMAYPAIDEPMYKPLSDISSELFLPNMNLIPPNSLTLLEANQRFIEAYIVGLNHEMGRELLWREFPTDERGSVFRQFWDPRSLLPPSPTPDDRELLRDVAEIHTFPRASALGTHNKRQAAGRPPPLVLVVRGELLKRYPTAVIYAQKAEWHRGRDGSVDVTAERELARLTPAEEESLPAAKIRKPLFEAKVEPDVYFIGFDLIAAEAKGGETAASDAGWFFVLKERPGEPRFGLDEAGTGALPHLVNWNNLTWEHLGTAPGEAIEMNDSPSLTAYVASRDQENRPDPDDAQARWDPETNAADLAYILYQVPALVAVHASRMLP